MNLSIEIKAMLTNGILVVFFSIILESAVRAQANPPENAKWYRYGEAVTLTGTLQRRSAYGPPGYGEDPKEDRVVHYYSLKFNEPINMMADTLKEWDYVEQLDVREVELIGIDRQDMRELSAYVGRKVTLKGMLYPRHFAHEFTEILLHITKGNGQKGKDVKSI